MSDHRTPRVEPGDRGQPALALLDALPSPLMREVRERLEQFAPSSVPILIQGETGTGKDVCAHAIREIYGPDRPFVALNCAAIPEALLESELFGHVRGAFTGAFQTREGLIAQADGGILFLDEIAEMSLATEAKMLRAIETGEYRPVGGDRDRGSEFRMLAATSTELGRLVKQKRFREDLFHRLGAVRITMPPLRERMEDVPVLAEQFLAGYRVRNVERGPDGLTEEAVALLKTARWPGNVRQLRNVVEAAAAKAGPGARIEAADIFEFLPTGEPELARSTRFPTLAEAVGRAEARVILEALRRTDGNRSEAADMLGVSEATLYRKLATLRSAGRLPALQLPEQPSDAPDA